MTKEATLVKTQGGKYVRMETWDEDKLGARGIGFLHNARFASIAPCEVNCYRFI